MQIEVPLANQKLGSITIPVKDDIKDAVNFVGKEIHKILGKLANSPKEQSTILKLKNSKYHTHIFIGNKNAIVSLFHEGEHIGSLIFNNVTGLLLSMVPGKEALLLKLFKSKEYYNELKKLLLAIHLLK